ncbi:hypothetical protein LCGC14_3139400 [marine sediment metagenome]|uniref:EF-hand domain-containing protein n=1 Tax=marine sediment metagenome TaxID=412755 RepID=A0A0F8VXA1_9ZZZZ
MKLMCVLVGLALSVSVVAEECIPNCNDDPGVNIMELVYLPDSLTAELWRLSMGEETSAVQVWARWDPAQAQIASIDCSPEGDPYALSLICYYDNELGIVNLMQVVNPPLQEPTAHDAIMATITFDADPGVVCFRDHLPHNLYASVQGFEIVPCLVGIPRLGDIDGDGDVDLSDLAALLASYGLCVGDPGYNPDADFDGNGCVDLDDLAEVLDRYGT